MPARMGKYFFTFSTISMGCAGPPRSRGSAAISSAVSIRSVIGFSFRSGLDVHRLPQPVGDEIEGDGGNEDGNTRNGGDQRLHVDRLPQRREHQTPVGRRRGNTEAKEGE